MLKEYQITNFKAFAGPANLPIKPITLIFGANSSGKSAILQSMLMLKQTVEGADSNISLLSKGNIVDLGSFREFIHCHDVKRSFSFKMTFSSPKGIGEAHDTDIEYGYCENDNVDILVESIGSETIGLCITFCLDSKSPNIIISNINLYLGDDPRPIISYEIGEKDERGSYQYEFKGNFNHKYWSTYWKYFDEESPEALEKLDEEYLDRAFNELSTELGWDKAEIGKLAYEGKKESFTKRLKEKDSKEENDLPQKQDEKKEGKKKAKSKEESNKLTGFAKAIQAYKRLFGSDVLGIRGFLPVLFNGLDLQLIIERYSYSDYAYSRDVSLFALTAANLIKKLLRDIRYIAPVREYPERFYIHGGNPLQYVGPYGEKVFDVLFNDSELLAKVNEEFKRFGADYELRLSRLSREGKEISESFMPQLVNKSTGVAASFRDVGFGFSQVLPVIVQSTLSKEKTILIEQPEIHLHPALQAELGDLFIKSALGEQKNCFIIETHSEHLLLRLMRRMRETCNGNLPDGFPRVRPEDVAVVYLEQLDGQSVVREMALNERGELVKAWPGGFFEEGLREVL